MANWLASHHTVSGNEQVLRVLILYETEDFRGTPKILSTDDAGWEAMKKNACLSPTTLHPSPQE